MKDRPTVYLAGPMSGVIDYNFPLFHARTEVLRDMGFEVINPAELDLEAGFDPTKDKITPEVQKAIVRRDCEALIDRADMLAVLPNYGNSKGTQAEIALAKWLRIPIWYLD